MGGVDRAGTRCITPIFLSGLTKNKALFYSFFKNYAQAILQLAWIVQPLLFESSFTSFIVCSYHVRSSACFT